MKAFDALIKDIENVGVCYKKKSLQKNYVCGNYIGNLSLSLS